MEGIIKVKILKIMDQSLPWHVVEASILKEKTWLLEMFDFSELGRGIQKNHPDSPISIDEMLRQISISIVRGSVVAKELKSEQVNGLWTHDSASWEHAEHEERHGGEWHQVMMAVVKKHFVEGGFEVVNEPNLNYGRADLGVYKEGFPNLFVEVGTTSLFKTWTNLHSMPNTTFLFIPSVHYAIELKTHKDFHPLKD